MRDAEPTSIVGKACDTGATSKTEFARLLLVGISGVPAAGGAGGAVPSSSCWPSGWTPRNGCNEAARWTDEE